MTKYSQADQRKRRTTYSKRAQFVVVRSGTNAVEQAIFVHDPIGFYPLGWSTFIEN
jgi:hypothetical protein